MTNILVVRPSALGDVFRTTPALVTLRKKAPEARIDCIVPEGFEDALRYHPALNEVIGFARRDFRHAWRNPELMKRLRVWVRSIRERAYDWVFDLQGLARSGLITRLTAAPNRVGFANAREFAWLGYNRRHYVDASLHHVDRLLGLLQAESCTPREDARIYVGGKDRQWCDALLRSQGWANQSFICLGPTSEWLSKCWPIDRFADIGQRLIDADIAGTRLVILHAPYQRDYIRPLLETLPSGAVIAPTTTVGQLMALIERSALVVCNDSAVAHAAVGFNRPMVCLYGPTDPALVGPYKRHDSVVRPPTSEGLGKLGYYRHLGSDQSLIAKISVDEVWEKILQQLGE